MNCVIHPDRTAAGMCVACGRTFCEDCLVNVAGRLQCRACGAAGPIPSHGKSPALAGILSFLIVGLGQVYNGQFLKGVLMFFGGIIILVLTGFFLFPLVWLWSIIDAVVAAQAISRGAHRRPMPHMASQPAPASLTPRAPSALAETATRPALARQPAAPAATPSLRFPDTSMLLTALRDHQQAERLIANLEKLKVADNLTEAEYGSMRGKYLEQANEADIRVEAARETIRRHLASAEERLAELRKRSRESELRHKVGELSESAHLAERQRLDPQVAQNEDFVDRLKGVAAANDPEELARYVEDSSVEPVVSEAPSGLPPASAAPPLPLSVSGSPTVRSVSAAPAARHSPVGSGSKAVATLATWGARVPLASETAVRLAWLSAGVMFVAALQSFSGSTARNALSAVATLTGLAAAVCVIASDTDPFRQGRVAAAALGILLWLVGIAFLWGRTSWWLFGLASIALLVSSLALLRD